MASGLSVSNVVNVSVSLSPTDAATRNFGALLLIGSTPVIDVQERIRVYADLDDVATDFGIAAPEYAAAVRFFSQSPQPALLYMGRWAQGASSGLLRGASLPATQQAIGNFNTIANGSFSLEVDGVARSVTGLDLTGATNLNGVASAINAKLTQATTSWDGTRFIMTSKTSGAASAVGRAASTGSGTDLSAKLGLAAGTSVGGVEAEPLVQAVNALADLSTDWYGLALATPNVSDQDILSVAAYVEAASPARVFGVTTQNAAALDAQSVNDVASALKGAGYSRTFVQFSSTDAYAAISALGRAFTVDFDGSNTTITLKFKREPGVTAETLSQSQANALKSKNCNVFINYQNGTAILQEGVMSNGTFFDERHGLDWLQNDVQTEVYNLLLDQPKIPQTDAGVGLIQTVVESRLSQAVTNGLIAPGVWNGPPLGDIVTGQTLSKGFYTYAPLIGTQSAAARAARQAPTIQAALKLAGAIHFADVVISVNR
ncbi:DUF3383 domain-containing protein [Chitinasiproducens palmae]|uniref:DUF3383 domain-containing protein n=1 Tax=Chitinasiproducens palmae TaxID=1770053 RepID=A0A1H2PRJ1_9BURK|nr:DUF3383 domain-containing protein [Chitinasiproducens palmae]SDV49082.1 Protein of unknown function [Chitinasiproducens palmae]